MDLVVDVRKASWQQDGSRGTPGRPVAPVVLLQHAGYQHQAQPPTGGAPATRMAFPFQPEDALDLLVFDEAAATEEAQFVGQACIHIAQMLDDGLTHASVPITSPAGLRGHLYLGFSVAAPPPARALPAAQEASPFARASRQGPARSGGGAPATPLQQPAAGGSSFGRRLSRLLPRWSSSSSGASSFRSADSFRRGSSGEAAEEAAHPLAALTASGQGPLTTWRQLRQSGPGSLQQAAAAAAATAAAAAHVQEQQQQQRTSTGGALKAALTPIPESPTPDPAAGSARTRAPSRIATGTAGAAAVAAGAPPPPVRLYRDRPPAAAWAAGGAGAAPVMLHSGYSSNGDYRAASPAAAQQQEDLYVRLAHQGALARADEAAIVAALAAQAARERAEEATLLGSLAAAGSPTALAPATAAAAFSPIASCTPEFASPYASLASSAASSARGSLAAWSGQQGGNDQGRPQARPGALLQAQAAKLVGGSASNPAALRRAALATTAAAAAAAAGAGGGEVWLSCDGADRLAPPPLSRAEAGGQLDLEALSASAARLPSPLQSFKYYPSVEQPGVAMAPLAARSRRHGGGEAGASPRPLDSFDRSDDVQVYDHELVHRAASPRYPVAPSGAVPAFMSGVGGGSEVRRMSKAAVGTLRGGRWMQPVAYTVPYPPRAACFPERCAHQEPSAPCLPVVGPGWA